ncbi:CvpA family protein [Metabacillus litoralis]|uniref:CvpA family protein n=1 Tax=Metabacillus litoralis TaxID=152268 RepID=A0A5C6VZV8_9BACI|nr:MULTISPECIES: CvpA family protein [Metabacillus]MBM7605690.1 putative membrane protein required for colicin V production [Metabacillus crassostreae]TXC90159.1 CvpA family protein [Metabacillus litoralis]
MLDFVLFIILMFGILVGLKRGFILQFIHLTGFVVAYIVAYQYFDDLAPKLKLWIPYPVTSEGPAILTLLSGEDLEGAFYRAVAFVILFIGTKIVMQIIGSMLDFVALLPILKQLNRWAGSILGFLESYLVLFILLFIGALLPIEQIQLALDQSVLADLIVNHTPYFSDKVNELWIQYISS